MAYENESLDDIQTQRLDGAARVDGPRVPGPRPHAAGYVDGVDRGPGVDPGTTDPNAVADPLAAPGPYDAFDPFDAPGVVDPYAPVDSFAGSGAGVRSPAPVQHEPWGGGTPRRACNVAGSPGATAPQAAVRPGETVAVSGAAVGAPRPSYAPYPPAVPAGPAPAPAPAPRADGQGGYDYNSLYEDPSAAKASAAREARAASRAAARADRRARSEASTPTAVQSRRGASILRWIVRLVCLGMLVFGIMVISSLTEQTVGETSSLSSSAQQLANKGAYLVETGQSPTREQDPVKWFGERILLLSVKLSNHGVDIRHQAHTLQFALMGGVVALNVLAWMSGWAHTRSSMGHIRSWRSLFMFVLSLAACVAVSFADQYHKLYVPGRHFDNLDLVFDAAGYIPAVMCVFTVWSVGSAVYRLVFRK